MTLPQRIQFTVSQSDSIVMIMAIADNRWCGEISIGVDLTSMIMVTVAE